MTLLLPTHMRLLFLLLFLFTSLSRAADNAAFSHALAAYKSGQYQTALDEFKKITADESQISAALCHNIGNCEYKIGQALNPNNNSEDDSKQRKEAEARYGQASIWYRRALALDPWLPEARQNLRFLQGKLGFHYFEGEGVLDKYSRWLKRSRWQVALVICLWVTVIAAVWLAWATPRRGRRWPLVTLVCVAAFLAAAAGSGLWLRMTERAPFAKLLVNKVSGPGDPVARSAPAEAAASVMPLRPGSELLPLREEGFWMYIEIPGGDADHPTLGWVRTTTTEKLWPWSPSLIE